MAYVEVPADVIRAKLTEAGFVLNPNVRGHEEVYDRKHNKDPRYVIRVYSSVTKAGETARGCGEDAIRVVALCVDDKFSYPPRTYPVFKSKRVHRTGSVEKVLERMLERAREAYAAINECVKGRTA